MASLSTNQLEVGAVFRAQLLGDHIALQTVGKTSVIGALAGCGLGRKFVEQLVERDAIVAVVPGGGGSRGREGKRVQDELFGDSGEARRFSGAGAEAEQCREKKYRAHELRMSLEGANQMRGDPAAIEIVSLRTHFFAVHKAGIHETGMEGEGPPSMHISRPGAGNPRRIPSHLCINGCD